MSLVRHLSKPLSYTIGISDSLSLIISLLVVSVSTFDFLLSILVSIFNSLFDVSVVNSVTIERGVPTCEDAEVLQGVVIFDCSSELFFFCLCFNHDKRWPN